MSDSFCSTSSGSEDSDSDSSSSWHSDGKETKPIRDKKAITVKREEGDSPPVTVAATFASVTPQRGGSSKRMRMIARKTVIMAATPLKTTDHGKRKATAVPITPETSRTPTGKRKAPPVASVVASRENKPTPKKVTKPLVRYGSGMPDSKPRKRTSSSATSLSSKPTTDMPLSALVLMEDDTPSLDSERHNEHEEGYEADQDRETWLYESEEESKGEEDEEEEDEIDQEIKKRLDEEAEEDSFDSEEDSDSDDDDPDHCPMHQPYLDFDVYPYANPKGGGNFEDIEDGMDEEEEEILLQRSYLDLDADPLVEEDDKDNPTNRKEPPKSKFDDAKSKLVGCSKDSAELVKPSPLRKADDASHATKPKTTPLVVNHSRNSAFTAPPSLTADASPEPTPKKKAESTRQETECEGSDANADPIASHDNNKKAEHVETEKQGAQERTDSIASPVEQKSPYMGTRSRRQRATTLSGPRPTSPVALALATTGDQLEDLFQPAEASPAKDPLTCPTTGRRKKNVPGLGLVYVDERETVEQDPAKSAKPISMEEKLMAAAKWNDLKYLRFVTSGENKGQVSKEAMAEALHMAVTKGHGEAVTILWKKGHANRHPRDPRKSANGKAWTRFGASRPDLSPLHAAVWYERMDILQQLLVDFQLDPNDLDENKDTALVLACQMNYLDAMRLLLDQGADPMLGCHRERCSVPKAEKDCKSEDDNGSVDPEKWQCGALYAAVEKSLVAATKMLLEHGVDPNKCPLEDLCTENDWHYLLLDMAMVKPNRELLKVLLEHGAKRFGAVENDNYEEPFLFQMGGSTKAQDALIRDLVKLAKRRNANAPGAKVVANYIDKCLRVAIKAMHDVIEKEWHRFYLGECQRLLEAGASTTWKGDGYTSTPFDDVLDLVASESVGGGEPPKIMLDIGVLLLRYGAVPTSGRKFGWLLLMAYKTKQKLFKELLGHWTKRFPTGRNQAQESLVQIVCGLPEEYFPGMVKVVMFHNARVLQAGARDWAFVECLNGRDLDVSYSLARECVGALLRTNFQYQKVFKESPEQITKRGERQHIRMKRQRAQRQRARESKRHGSPVTRQATQRAESQRVREEMARKQESQGQQPRKGILKKPTVVDSQRVEEEGVDQSTAKPPPTRNQPARAKKDSTNRLPAKKAVPLEEGERPDQEKSNAKPPTILKPPARARKNDTANKQTDDALDKKQSVAKKRSSSEGEGPVTRAKKGQANSPPTNKPPTKKAEISRAGGAHDKKQSAARKRPSGEGEGPTTRAKSPQANALPVEEKGAEKQKSKRLVLHSPGKRTAGANSTPARLTQLPSNLRDHSKESLVKLLQAIARERDEMVADRDEDSVGLANDGAPRKPPSEDQAPSDPVINPEARPPSKNNPTSRTKKPGPKPNITERRTRSKSASEEADDNHFPLTKQQRTLNKKKAIATLQKKKPPAADRKRSASVAAAPQLSSLTSFFSGGSKTNDKDSTTSSTTNAAVKKKYQMNPKYRLKLSEVKHSKDGTFVEGKLLQYNGETDTYTVQLEGEANTRAFTKTEMDWAVRLYETIGQRVAKYFGDDLYLGSITNADGGVGLFQVEYDDGDQEDLNEAEATEALKLFQKEDTKKKKAPKRKAKEEAEEVKTTKRGRKTKAAPAAGPNRPAPAAAAPHPSAKRRKRAPRWLDDDNEDGSPTKGSKNSTKIAFVSSLRGGKNWKYSEMCLDGLSKKDQKELLAKERAEEERASSEEQSKQQISWLFNGPERHPVDDSDEDDNNVPEASVARRTRSNSWPVLNLEDDEDAVGVSHNNARKEKSRGMPRVPVASRTRSREGDKQQKGGDEPRRRPPTRSSSGGDLSKQYAEFSIDEFF